MTSATIRKAEPNDLEKIHQLINSNLDRLLPRTKEELVELLELFIVAEMEGEIVGAACLEVYSPKIAELRTLVVDPRCRGAGIGALLVQEIIEEFKRRNIRQLLVVTSNLEFFNKMNFGPCLNEKYALFWRGGEGIS